MDLKRFIARFIALAMTLVLATPNSAMAGGDEQWPLPNTPELGHHSIVIEDSIDFFKLFSFIETTDVVSGKTISCESLDAPGCKTAKDFHVNAGFNVCKRSEDADCIELLRFTSPSGEEVAAEFVQFAYSNHPNMFSGDGKLLAKTIGLPSIWRAPGAGHAGGELYLVVAGLKGGVHKSSGGWRNMELYASVFPIREFMEPRFEVRPGSYAFPLCTYSLDQNQVRISTGCAGSAADFGYVRCVAFKQDGTCLLRQAHNLDQQIELSIRLLRPASGWFHGRVIEPSVAIERVANFSRVVVSAKPVRVPTFFMGGLYSEMDAAERSYWDECLPKGTCASSTRIPGSAPSAQRDGNLRNVQSYEDPVGDRSLAIISRFAERVEDRAIAAPTSWSFRTLGTNGEGEIFRCTSNAVGVVAMISTNATAYSEGPPSLRSGQLNYRVGGLHYAPDGKSLNLGTYDLLLRSDVARCLYGFSKAPISATITVLGTDGEQDIATTVVSERDGWLKLAAYGFTFSEKEIKVRVTQPQTRTLTAFSRTATALTPKQKAEIRATVSMGAANPKFICTGIRLEGQPQALNTLVRKRAKAACDYAKSLNPKLSTFFQTKTTKAASFNGKVLVVSK